MLRIFIPALQVGPGLTGVGVYTLELIRGMARLDRREHIGVGAPHPECFDFLEGLDGFERIPLSLGGSGAWARMLATHTVVPRAAERWAARVLLGPNFIGPLWGRFDTAVMVHDLAFQRFPETTTRAKRLYYELLVRRSVRRARRVFVSTRTVGEEVVEAFPEAAGKIWRTPEGVSPSYLENGDRERKPAAALTERARRDFLFVGTLEPRKNLVRLLTAHSNLCRAHPEFPALRMVGGKGWEDEGILRALAEHSDPSRLVRLGYRDQQELLAEYNSALALLFPSMYEGFGLPILEAMARGCPVITSRGIATEEVAGHAALLVDPFDTGDIERALVRLSHDSGLRRKLAEAGRTRVREFSWERCARETLDGLHALYPSSVM